MDSPPIDNQTSFAAHPQMLLGKRGEQLAVAIKATYELSASSGRLELAPKERQRGLRLADLPWGKPESTSIKYPCDLAAVKPGTDVVVVAKGYPPTEGAPVKSFNVFVKVGELSSGLVVHGPRIWDTKGAAIAAALAATPIELRYEFAWGGRDTSNPDKLVEDTRNPVGLGVVSDLRLLTEKFAPSIEYADAPIKNATSRPEPAGFGAIARSWLPRRNYMGTYDKAWKDNRAPLLPDDEDDRFYCFASRGLHADSPLYGFEEVGLLNLLPEGQAARFWLPGVGVDVEFRMKNRDPEKQRPHLDTVLIDTLGVEAGLPLTVELIWHASTKAPRKMLDSKTVIRKIRLS
jgi:hypothetical protein